MKNLHLLNVSRSRTFGIVITILIIAFIGVFLFDYVDAAYLNYAIATPTGAPQGELNIVINAHGRVLELYNDGKIYKRYRVAVGKQATPTPIGEWKIVYKGYSPEAKFGTRWMGLDISWGSYGIHGTNMPGSIGYFASNGCIRLRNKDVEELYEWIPVGTPVRIIGPKPRIDRTLRRNTVGTDVVVLQLRLVELGYFQERANGNFGKETEAALRAFQRDKRLPETGIADDKTLRMLGIH